MSSFTPRSRWQPALIRIWRSEFSDYHRIDARRDLIAGLTVAAVAPQFTCKMKPLYLFGLQQLRGVRIDEPLELMDSSGR